MKIALPVLLVGVACSTFAGEWREKFYDGLEAQGEVREIADGYRGKDSAVAFKHISGAKIFGAEKQLETTLKGVVDWTVSAEVKGNGAAEAGVAMEFFNAEGRSLGIVQGEGVKATAEWTPHTWKFMSPAAAKTSWLHILSLDAGTVAFAQVAVSSAQGNASSSLPFKAVALPFSWNKDWNGGRYLFTSFAESPQPMSFHFKGDRSKLQTPAFELDIPDDLEIRDCFTEHAEFWGPEKPVSEVVHVRNGISYRRLRYENVRVFRILDPSGYAWERKLTLVPAPKDKAEWKDRTYRCYWRLGDKTRMEPESAIDIRFVSLPTGLRTPKKFAGLSWQSDDRLYSDDATFLAAAKAWEMSGLNTFVRTRDSFKRGQELIALLKSRPVKWRFTAIFPDMWGARFLSPDSDGYKALNPPLSVFDDGRQAKKLCPQYFNTDPGFKAYYQQHIVKDRLASFNPEDDDAICFDFEPWSSSHHCFCDRCVTAFMKRQGLSQRPSIKEIQQKYLNEWAAFRCDQTEASVALFCQAVREFNPRLTIADYDYIQMYGTKDEKVFYTGCAKNSRQDEKWFDIHVCSYYHALDRKAFLAISNNTEVLEKPYLPLGAVGGYGDYLRAGEVRTPKQIRMLALASAVHGCPGVGFYSGIHYDGEILLALMKARDEIASVEAFPWGKPAGVIRAVSENPEFVYKTCAVDGYEVVALFNYDKKNAATVRLLSGVDFKCVAKDPVTREALSDGMNLKDGMTVSVPAEDVCFIVFKVKSR